MFAVMALVTMMSLVEPAVDPAAAPEADLQLTWSAPAGCPGGETVRRAAMALVEEVELEREAGTVRARRTLVAEGRVSPHAGGGFALTLKFRGDGADAERVLIGETCAAVSDTAVLLLAIAVEPQALGGVAAIPPPASDLVPQPPDRSPTMPPAPVASEPRAAATTERPAIVAGQAPGESVVVPEAREAARGRTPGPRPSIGVRVRGGGAVGLLPGAAAGGGLGLTLARGRALGELYGTFMGPGAVVSATHPWIGGRFSMWSGGLRGCGVLALWRARSGALGLAAPLCGIVEVGAVFGRGTGALAARDAISAWAALGAGAALRLDLRPWVALWLEAEALVSLARPRFHTEPSGPLWQVGRGGGRFSLGLEFRFELRDRRSGGQAASQGSWAQASSPGRN